MTCLVPAKVRTLTLSQAYCLLVLKISDEKNLLGACDRESHGLP